MAVPLKIDILAADKTRPVFDRVNRSANMLISSLAGIGVGLGVGKIIQTADKYTLLSNRLALVTDSTRNLKDVQEELYKISRDTRTDYAGTIDIYTRIARSTQQLGISQQDLLTITQAINQSLIISGSSAQASEAALIQLGQGMASGTLRGEELNSVLEQAPRLAEALAQGMGVSVGQLRELGKQGKITSENVVNALLNQSGAIASEYGRMEATVGQAMTVINNSLGHLISGANESTSVTSLLADKIIEVAGNIDTWADNNRELIDQKLPEYVDNIKNGLTDIWNFIASNADVLEYGLLGLAIGGKKGMIVGAGYTAFADMWREYTATNRGQTKFLLESQQKMKEIYNPQLDWSGASGSGEFLQALQNEQGELQISLASTHQEFSKIDTALKDYFSGMDKATSATKKYSAAIPALGDKGKPDKIKLLTPGKVKTKAFLSESEYGSELEKTRDMLDNLSLVSLPVHQQRVEEITRKYAEWEHQIEDLAGAGKISMDQAEQWSVGLGENMQRELDDLVVKTEEVTAKTSEFWLEAQRNMQDFTKDTFVSIIKGQYDDLGESFSSLCQNMVANWLAAQMQMALWGDNPQTPGGGNGLIGAGIDWAKGLFSPAAPATTAGIDTALTSFFDFFANGGIMTPAGALPLQKYASGGIADRPQVALFGEGRLNEAYVPLPDGRSIPVTMRGRQQAQQSLSMSFSFGDIGVGNERFAAQLQRDVAASTKKIVTRLMREASV